MSNKPGQGLSDKIMNMKFMKNEILNDPNKVVEDENNWQTNVSLGDLIDSKINPLISVYNKPISLVKKIYENARRNSNKNKAKAEVKNTYVEDKEMDFQSFRRKNRKNIKK